ncbi:MAG: hypothetical protein HY843_00910 [Bdellovibrio sp.]|nr:hypothetical protein [Bdellovibrio sp.]
MINIRILVVFLICTYQAFGASANDTQGPVLVSFDSREDKQAKTIIIEAKAKDDYSGVRSISVEIRQTTNDSNRPYSGFYELSYSQETQKWSLRMSTKRLSNFEITGPVELMDTANNSSKEYVQYKEYKFPIE